MLEGKYSQCDQQNCHSNFGCTPFSRHNLRIVFSLFPNSSDVCSCGTRVAADEITWTNGAGYVGAFGQVLSLVAGGKDAAVATGGWSSPCSYFALICGDCERPASVDELDGAPADFVLSKDIYDSYKLFLDLNSGKPKEQQRYDSDERNRWQRCERNDGAFIGKDEQPSDCHDDDAGYSYYSAGARPEYLHAMSLACNEEVLS